MNTKSFLIGSMIVVGIALATISLIVFVIPPVSLDTDLPTEVAISEANEQSLPLEQGNVGTPDEITQQTTGRLEDIKLILLIQAMAIGLSIILAGVSFYLFRARISLDTTGALVPERWGQTINALTSIVKKQQGATEENTSALIHAAQRTDGALQQIGEQTKSLKDMLLSFQDALNAKDAAISDLEKGRDFQVKKKLLGELVDLHSRALKYSALEPNNKLLNSFAVLLEQILEGNDIEIGWPEIGSRFQDHPELLEAIGHVQQAEKAFEKGDIVEVLSPYYKHQGLKFASVIRKANIKYYLGKEG